MVHHTPTPFYQRLSLVLLSITILCLGLFYGKGILLPIFFAILLAMLLLPITNFLARKKFPKTLSIIVPLLLSIVTIGAVVYFLSSQIINFLDDAPALRERITEVSVSFQRWLTSALNISVPKQNQYLKDAAENIKGEAPKIVGVTFFGFD